MLIYWHSLTGTHIPGIGLGLLLVYWFTMSMVLLNWCGPLLPVPDAPAVLRARMLCTYKGVAKPCAASLLLH